MNANSDPILNKAAKIALTSLITMAAFCATGCNTADYRAAMLYKSDGKTPVSFERLRVASDRPNQYFNGNLIQVPPGQLAQFDLKELKIGILADKDTAFQSFPKTRTLPERMLWLVVQIEAFKSDDFLRTASKRSFFASAVKQNQNSGGYVALDSSESSFALQTADWQYEVTFTLYSVDNFKLKQAIGFIAKDNEGLIKIGYDALKQFGGATYSLVADPFFRLAKHEFGDAFLFERALLTAGAVTEFKGMVYVIRPINGGISASGEYALADLSDVPAWEDLKSLERNYLKVPASPRGKQEFLSFRDPAYRAAYSTTLTAINHPVLDTDLRAKEANFLMFKLSTRADENRRQSGIQQKALPHEEELRRLNSHITGSITANAKTTAELASSIRRLQAAAQTVGENIKREKPTEVEAIAQYQIAVTANNVSDEIRAAAEKAVGSENPDELETEARNRLSSLGIIYTKDSSPLSLATDPRPQVIVGAKNPSKPSPEAITAQLASYESAAAEILPHLEKYSSEIDQLQRFTEVQNFQTNQSLAKIYGDITEAAKKLKPIGPTITLQSPKALLEGLANDLKRRKEEEATIEKISRETDSLSESKTKIF
jgi:hypothetical protein